jgi:hypothetical protein
LPLGYANGFTKIAQGTFNCYMVALTTEQQADGRIIVSVFHPIIHGRQIKIHLPGKFGLERLHLKINHDIAAEPEVIKQEINLVILAADFKMDLTPHKREANTKFEQEFLDVVQ